LKSILKGSKNFCFFLICNAYVPIISNIKPTICHNIRDSFKNIEAKIATNPGVKTNNGRAELSSRLFIAFITQKKAIALSSDLKNRTSKPVVEGMLSIERKKGITRMRFIKARKAVNSATLSLKRIFFSIIEASAEKSAEIIAINVQSIFLKY